MAATGTSTTPRPQSHVDTHPPGTLRCRSLQDAANLIGRHDRNSKSPRKPHQLAMCRPVTSPAGNTPAPLAAIRRQDHSDLHTLHAMP